MAIYSYWFLLSLVLLALEMATGTFYLMMLSLAMVAGGTAALLNANLEWQVMLCALTVVAGTLILRRWKSTKTNKPADTSLDVGQQVQVLSWHKNGTARVLYRGAEWDAEPESADMPREGRLYIKQMRGSSLVLTHHKP